MATNPGLEIEIFTEAIQLPPEERAAFLDRACGENGELRRKIETLLNSNERVAGFLESPIIAEGKFKAVIGEKPGDWIDRYKLLGQIGEGGYGVVFLAEQELPVLRRVALKVVKPGMDTRSVIARFEAERQALALMDHPNIAHVFDAGTTASGRPYFVMELVEGFQITDYCDRHSLAINDRLKLFIQVCSAIQHAHQKGIIHRDVKPSNVLVATGTDGKPVPKVIDFGIAKATGGQRLTDKTIFTAHEMLLGTPAYMSPEQAALTSVDVDTRSDIYSLGVLLYELLTGSPPFDNAELLKNGVDDLRRTIRDEEPAPPSTRLSVMKAVDLTTISRHRGGEPPKLIRDMRGDLDWVVMRAMEKDRTRRYPTVNALAMDIERCLTGETVLARPPSKVYKARKLIARNKLLSASFALVFFLLVAGLGVTMRLWIVERQTRERVQREEEVYQLEGLAVAQLLQDKVIEADGKLRQAFKMRHQFLHDQPPNAMIAADFLMVLNKEGKDDEAISLLNEFPRQKLLATPGYPILFARYTTDMATKGHWKEAAASATYTIEYEPNVPAGYHRLAPLLVACHDIPEYRRLCQQISARFSGIEDPDGADQMAKDCLILPDSGADLKVIGRLADTAVTRGKNHGAYTFFECCKALAEYRQENFEEAIKWSRTAVKDPFPYTRAEGYAILAMAQFKSGQTNEARVALADCEQVIEKRLPKLNSGDLGNDWRDWIIGRALRDEAKKLIEGDGKPEGIRSSDENADGIRR